jgi:hypothetical protein
MLISLVQMEPFVKIAKDYKLYSKTFYGTYALSQTSCPCSDWLVKDSLLCVATLTSQPTRLP